MSRIITTHLVAPETDTVTVLTLDNPGQGGAYHVYALEWVDKNNTLCQEVLSFQNGPIKEYGVNGITQEALLAVVIDRLTCFQAGPFACETNQEALDHCAKALEALHRRTRDRIARQVEGLNKA